MKGTRVLLSLGGALAGLGLVLALLDKLFSEWQTHELTQNAPAIFFIAAVAFPIAMASAQNHGWPRSQAIAAGRNTAAVIGSLGMLMLALAAYRHTLIWIETHEATLRVILWTMIAVVAVLILFFIAVYINSRRYAPIPRPVRPVLPTTHHRQPVAPIPVAAVHARPATLAPIPQASTLSALLLNNPTLNTCPHCGLLVRTGAQFCSSCGQDTKRKPVTVQPGYVLPVINFHGQIYTCDKVLGQGGEGRVFRSVDKSGKYFAVKELLLDPAESAAEQTSTVLRFLAEADQLKIYKHNAIPQLVGSIEQNGVYYIILEYIDGVTLETLIKSMGTLPESLALHFAGQLVDFLSYLHARKRIFLDLKPGNLMITRTTTLKVVDFGITSAELKVAVREWARGSDGFFSPEQAQGIMIPECDYYALGANLWFGLTGKDPRELPPFTQLADPRLVNPGVKISDRTANAIVKLTQLKYEHRPRNINDVKALLGL